MPWAFRTSRTWYWLVTPSSNWIDTTVCAAAARPWATIRRNANASSPMAKAAPRRARACALGVRWAVLVTGAVPPGGVGGVTGPRSRGRGHVCEVVVVAGHGPDRPQRDADAEMGRARRDGRGRHLDGHVAGGGRDHGALGEERPDAGARA